VSLLGHVVSQTNASHGQTPLRSCQSPDFLAGRSEGKQMGAGFSGVALIRTGP
jgi:hypothetical protein